MATQKIGASNDLIRFGGNELEKASIKARDISWKNFGKKIRFYAPSFAHYETSHFHSTPTAFPTISITGSSCDLRCKHCGGRVLKTMIPVTTPEELITECTKLRERGALGCLISGGCLPNGSIPFNKFIDAITKVKQDTELTIIVHTGIIDPPTARKLRKSGIDAALIDVIGSDATIHEIYQLDVKVDDYRSSLEALFKAGIPTVPHVLVGLHYGKIKGELQALRIISEFSPSAVIIIALMPTYGTSMQNVTPPTPEDVAEVLVAARLMMPKTPVVLGCMRPKGEHRIRTDTLAVKAGVNAIAFPTEKAIRLAESLGLKTTFSPICCSQIFQDIGRGILSEA
ncbi:MAG: radical SAM protein [Candidatus Bathyarchaeota archaeon]|nr:MAG: radical SAM protein [Candidatus Bathyarchaeota archaeon]